MKFSILFVLALLLFTACKKEQPQPNNGLENCACAHEVSADFTMEELTTGNLYFAKYTETDSIFANKNVRFRAKEMDAQYTWYIGSEVLTDQEVSRYFSSSYVGQTISISLVVKKNPNQICFPNDDGYDSITKTIYVAPAFDAYGFFNDPQPFFEGTYRMKDASMSDSVDITIDAVYIYEGLMEKVILKNYNGVGDTLVSELGGHNYRQLFLDPHVYNNSSYWHHNLNGTYEIYLDPYLYNPIILPKFHYYGRKLN